MQQREFQQVRRFLDAIASGNKLGGANRKKLLRAKPHDIEPGPIAMAVSHRQVDFLTREVDVMHRCRYPQIDVGVSLGKPAEPMHQPFGGKVG